MVKRYHASFPSLSYGFNSRYPLHVKLTKLPLFSIVYAPLQLEIQTRSGSRPGKSREHPGAFGNRTPAETPAAPKVDHGQGRCVANLPFAKVGIPAIRHVDRVEPYARVDDLGPADGAKKHRARPDLRPCEVLPKLGVVDVAVMPAGAPDAQDIGGSVSEFGPRRRANVQRTSIDRKASSYVKTTPASVTLNELPCAPPAAAGSIPETSSGHSSRWPPAASMTGRSPNLALASSSATMSSDICKSGSYYLRRSTSTVRDDATIEP